MSEPRIVVETPCEHGSYVSHAGIADRAVAILQGIPDCPGGSRVVYTREEAIEKVRHALRIEFPSLGVAAPAVDALLGSAG